MYAVRVFSKARQLRIGCFFMSTWIIPEKEDIDLSDDEKEIHIYIESDNSGARYISVEGAVFEYLKELLKNK